LVGIAIEDIGIFATNLNILWPNGLFWCHLVHFVAMCYIFHVLVCCNGKNLATLAQSRMTFWFTVLENTKFSTVCMYKNWAFLSSFCSLVIIFPVKPEITDCPEASFLNEFLRLCGELAPMRRACAYAMVAFG
jgi:hypothetical protein